MQAIISLIQIVAIKKLMRYNVKSKKKRLRGRTITKILKLRENKDLIHEAAQWFHQKWEISAKAYESSMQESIKAQDIIPQWYIVVDDGKIIAGAGVIANDSHNRKDLTPNICALYVNKIRRNESIAGNLLQYICDDMEKLGIATIYLVTDHDSFYEKYGWQFLGMVKDEEGSSLMRLYEHQQ